MSAINKNEIRVLRANSMEMARELETRISHLQSQLVALKERIKVYDELITGSPPTLMPIGEDRPSGNDKKRGQRSTKSEMNRRREVIRKLLHQNGAMQPRVLLQLAQEELGESFEAHHLRAVLRKYTAIFAPSPDQHGLWMTISPVSLAAVQSSD